MKVTFLVGDAAPIAEVERAALRAWLTARLSIGGAVPDTKTAGALKIGCSYRQLEYLLGRLGIEYSDLKMEVF